MSVIARFDGNVSYEHGALNAPVTVVPLTMACWVTRTNSGSEEYCMSVNRQVLSGSTFVIGSGMEVGTNIFAFAAFDSLGGGWGASNWATTFELDRWYHLVGVARTSTDRQLYVNGQPGPVNTETVVPPDIDAYCIGSTAASSFGGRWTGNMAHPATWKRALTDGEIRALASGAHPMSIARDYLASYHDIPNKHGVGDTLLETQATAVAFTTGPELIKRTEIFLPPLFSAVAARTLPTVIASIEFDNSDTENVDNTHGFTLLEDDIILAFHAINATADGEDWIDNNGANAFTETAYLYGGTNAAQGFHWVVDDVADTAFAWTASVGAAGHTRAGTLYVQVRNVDLTDIFSGAVKTLDGSSPSPTLDATDADNALCIAFASSDAVSDATDQFSGYTNSWTEILETNNTGGQKAVGLELDQVTQGVPATTAITGNNGGVWVAYALNGKLSTSIPPPAAPSNATYYKRRLGYVG